MYTNIVPTNGKAILGMALWAIKKTQEVIQNLATKFQIIFGKIVL